MAFSRTYTTRSIYSPPMAPRIKQVMIDAYPTGLYLDEVVRTLDTQRNVNEDPFKSSSVYIILQGLKKEGILKFVGTGETRKWVYVLPLPSIYDRLEAVKQTIMNQLILIEEIQKEL
jgi:hypothetical protein